MDIEIREFVLSVYDYGQRLYLKLRTIFNH